MTNFLIDGEIKIPPIEGDPNVLMINTVPIPQLQSLTTEPDNVDHTYLPSSGYDGFSDVTVKKVEGELEENVCGYTLTIPSAPVPMGTKNITENGTYDVKDYVSAVVDIALPNNDLSKIISRDNTLQTVDLSGHENQVIGKYAFYEMSGIKSIIGDITEVKNYGLYRCSNLERITGARITKIADNGIRECPKLESLTFGETVEIGEYGLHGCTNLVLSEIPATKLTARSLSECRSLVNIIFTKDITGQGKTGIFTGSTNIKSITFKKTCNIGCGSFDGFLYGLTGLQKINFIGAADLGKYNVVTNLNNLRTINIATVPSKISSVSFNNSYITDINVSWSQGDVAGAPWGATNANISYNTTFDENGDPITP